MRFPNSQGHVQRSLAPCGMDRMCGVARTPSRATGSCCHPAWPWPGSVAAPAVRDRRGDGQQIRSGLGTARIVPDRPTRRPTWPGRQSCGTQRWASPARQPTSNEQVAVPDFRIVVGEHDSAQAIGPEPFMLSEFAGGDPLLPPMGCRPEH